LTGDLGRPQIFSPIRRSSLYLELVRLVISMTPDLLFLSLPGAHHQDLAKPES
jgi:hypothetical protein